MNIAIKPAYFFIGVALMLSACSQDDTSGRIEGKDNRIVFRTSLPELTSRAKVVTEDNLPYFYVTAFDFEDQTLMDGGVMQPLFANEKVDIVDNKNVYTSSNCCWPDQTKESHAVSFFGFYPGLAEVDGAQLVNASTAGTLDYKLTGFRVAADIADQLDFVTAYASGSMADDLFSGIMLPFVHQLSRIEIKAYGAHKSCDIEIAGVRIGGICTEGTFVFKPERTAGEWNCEPTRGFVEYIYHSDNKTGDNDNKTGDNDNKTGDKIFKCGKNCPVDSTHAISIMGTMHDDGNDNCAMLIPSTYAQWDYAEDRRNANNQMYISVLLRVTDAMLSAGKDPVEKQRYPYKDLSQGADALNIPKVYLSVDKETQTISGRVYKSDNKYYTDEKCTAKYTLPENEEIKEFGWAALPVSGDWKPGYIYTYTLDYTYGVGLHDPDVDTSAPKAGDPVISDKVGITYTVKEWEDGGGSEFPVPGS